MTHLLELSNLSLSTSSHLWPSAFRLLLTKEISWRRASPVSGSHSQPLFFSQLQRFKRSLSLKTILRSKSVENFFLRSGSELKCPTEVLLTPPTPLPPPSPPLASTDRGLPTPAPSPCPVPRPLASLKPVRLHSFQEHVFKRASPCELCHQLIVGRCLRRARDGPGWVWGGARGPTWALAVQGPQS